MKIKIILSLIVISFLGTNLIAQKDLKTDKDNVATKKTIKNVKRIINSELLSYEFYTNCSSKALKDGYPKIANQFTDIATMENAHYLRFKDIISKMKVDFKETKPQYVILSTKDNVNSAFQKEEVAIKIYERAIKQAQSDGNKEAEEAFIWANDMEKMHAQIFKKIFDNFDSYKEN